MRLQNWCSVERGRAAALAARIRVHPVLISQWAAGARPVPAVHCPAIERETGGEVRRWELRPDDWWRHWPELIGAEGAPEPPPSEGSLTSQPGALDEIDA